MKNLLFKTRVTVLSILMTLLLINTSCTTAASEDKPAQTAEVVQEPDMTIHEAAFMGDLEQIKKHIAAGSDLNEKDAYGSTPLGVAATFNKPEVAALLIEGGADVNAKGGDGSTALHTAAFFCRKEIVKSLLDGGVDTSIRNNYGSTALESIMAPFENVKPIYDQMSRDLGPMGFKLDYDYLKATRPVIADMIRNSNK